MFRFHQRLLIASLTGLWLTGAWAQAQDPALACHWQQPALPPFDGGQALKSGQVAVSAQRVDLSSLEQTRFTGSVDILADAQRLRADEVVLDRSSDRARATGNVTYAGPDLTLQAQSATLGLSDDSLAVQSLSYSLQPGLGRGSASRAQRPTPKQTRLDEVTFTACPAGNDDWLLTADQMSLDHAEGRASARNLTLRFKDVPILYLPRASFPLDDRRKSGFLVPAIGSTNDDGLDLAQPYYFNLAPERDLTLTPRFISDRGAMLMADFRYLGRQRVGELGFEHMPNDDRTGDHRSYAWWRHNQRLGGQFDLLLDINHVSDDRYFEDLGNSLSVTSRSLLRSLAQLSTSGQWWTATLGLDAYESVDDTLPASAEPYERLPRLQFEWDQPLGPLRLRLDSELTAFNRSTGTEGQRLDLLPRVSYPVYGAGWTLQPSLGLRHTRYDLDRAPQDSPTRTTPIAELEGRLIFERALGQRVQTLEPRIYLLYVPFEEQDELPTFDTRELTFGFSQLFRFNRFSGGDRQGDASQVTLALTSRVLEPDTGATPLELSVGTIAYLRDRRVRLDGSGPDTRNTSPLVTELTYRPSDAWQVRFGFQYEPDPLTDGDRIPQAQLRLNYRGEGGRLVNFAYRKRSQIVDQVDLSAWLPLDDRWSLVGRVNYSFLGDQLLEGLLGFQYDSCCWTTRLFARRFVRSLEGEERTALYLELELKGLGSLGRTTGRVLERSIVGYQHDR